MRYDESILQDHLLGVGGDLRRNNPSREQFSKRARWHTTGMEGRFSYLSEGTAEACPYDLSYSLHNPSQISLLFGIPISLRWKSMASIPQGVASHSRLEFRVNYELHP